MLRKMFKICVISLLVLGLPGNSFSQSRKDLAAKERPTFYEIQQAVYQSWKDRSDGQKPGYKQFKRWEWFAKNRLDKDGYFDPTLNWRGWLEKKQRFDAAKNAAANWVSLGPFNVPSSIKKRNSSAGVGRLNCLAFDPRNIDIIWVGAPSGGLWKTTDGGMTWTTNTDHLPNLGVSEIVIHPQNPHIMYIATGDRDAGNTFSIGVLKSTDGGETWNTTGLNPLVGEQMRVFRMIMHPTAQDTLLAAANRGIYKTSDGGSTWTKKITGNYRDMEIDPANPNTWYAARSGNGVYKSTDCGETWTQLTNGLPSHLSDYFGRIAIAVSGSSPDILYALYTRSNVLYGLYRSVDRGDSWTLQADKPNLMGRNYDGFDNDGLGGYALVLAVSPADADVVYVGSINIFKSTDAGLTWKCIAHQEGAGGSPALHWDHHNISFLPGDGKTLFSCHDGGLHKSTDEGATWIDLSNGLVIHQVYRLGLSARDPRHVIIGSQDLGSDMLAGEWFTLFGGDGMECMIDPTDSSVIYFSCQNTRLFRSTDGGISARTISSQLEGGLNVWVTPFVMDPVDSQTLYAATTKLYKTTYRGERWESIGEGFTGVLNSLEIAPSNPYCIYVSNGRSLFKTGDGGGSWQEMYLSELPAEFTDFAVHPRNPEIIWATIGGYGIWNSKRNSKYNNVTEKVFRSDDGGANWTDITGLLPNIPANCIVVDPFSFGVYVGTDLGVFYSASGRGDWEAFDSGLPNVVVTELEIHLDAGKIVASTYGRGVWESPLASAPVFPDPCPPLYFSGLRQENKSLLQKEFLDLLTWGANPRNEQGEVVRYRLYRENDGSLVLLSDLEAGIFEYHQRGVGEAPSRYRLAAVSAQGIESPPLFLKVR